MNFFVSLSILIFIFSFWDSFDFAPMYCHPVVLLLSESLRNRENRQYESNAILAFLHVHVLSPMYCHTVALLLSESLRNRETRQYESNAILDFLACKTLFSNGKQYLTLFLACICFFDCLV